MPIIANFPGGSGSGGGGLVLAAVTGLSTLAASGKVYIKWTDPDDIVVSDSTLAAWSGTLLVRKAGGMPTSRRDGTIVLDNKTRNAYSTTYFCDSGLTNGTTYYYKLFPYTTANAYTDDTADEFSATPTVQVAGISSWNVSGITTAAAGDGKMTVKWTDPAANITSDGVTLATWAATTIVVKEGSYPTSKDDSDAAYTLKVTTRNQYSSSALTISGLTNRTTYYIQFFPETTDGGISTSTSNRATGVPNRMTITTTPSQSGTLTYTGSSQTPSWSNYSTTQLTLSGTTSGTNAGSYNATFAPTTDYMWSDGATTAKTVAWTIGKATGSLTLSTTSVTLNTSTTSATVTISGNFDGTYSVSSSNASVATARVSSKAITIKSVNSTTGTATITVSCSGGTNYTVPSSKTISVAASFVSTTLNDNTWAVISDVSAKQTGANYWSVGDCKSVSLSGTVGTLSVSGTYWVYILGFDHNSSYEGTGIQFGCFKTAQTDGTDICLVDKKYDAEAYSGTKYFNMNHWGSSSSPYNTNYGGWSACDLRYDILGSTDTQPSVYGKTKTTSAVGYDASTTTATNPVANALMAALPSDLRAVMKPITKYQDNKGNSSNTAANVTATVDYLPLLAEFEIFGIRTHANQYEQNYQAQYAYYSAGNSNVKYKHNDTSSAAYWWVRSPKCNNNYGFDIMNPGGSVGNDSSYRSNGLAPAFMV